MSDTGGTPGNVKLKARLEADLTSAMKAQDALTLATLRMTLAAIKTEEVAGKQARELDESEVLRVIQREAKKRVEAAEAFTGAGRDELAAREQAEGEVLARYLPTPLTADELAAVVTQVISESQPVDQKAFGRLMKTVTASVAGRANGAAVAAELKRQLST